MRLDEEQKKRLHKVLLITGGVCLLLLAYALFVRFAGFGLPCMYYQLFGLQCAGCGLSRASAALVRLDFRSAFEYNALWPLYLGYVLWAVPRVTVPYVRDGRAIGVPRPVGVSWVTFGALLAYGVIRNFIS